MRLRINGTEHELTIDTRTSLLDLLRARLDLTGAKGVGEIGIVGTAAAVADAVHHATGIRVRGPADPAG